MTREEIEVFEVFEAIKEIRRTIEEYKERLAGDEMDLNIKIKRINGNVSYITREYHDIIDSISTIDHRLKQIQDTREELIRKSDKLREDFFKPPS